MRSLCFLRVKRQTRHPSRIVFHFFLFVLFSCYYSFFWNLIFFKNYFLFILVSILVSLPSFDTHGLFLSLAFWFFSRGVSHRMENQRNAHFDFVWRVFCWSFVALIFCFVLALLRNTFLSPSLHIPTHSPPVHVRNQKLSDGPTAPKYE